jgi:pyruvate dehydrogenase E2 component (dihydrolipoamide acetyltransferase)
MEVEAADSGYLISIQVKLGEKVPVGAVIATLGDAETLAAAEDTSAAVPLPLETAALRSAPAAVGAATLSSSVEAPPSRTSSAAAFAASPRARRLAQELGIDITAVTPARGPRVVEEDVRRHVASREQIPPVPASSGIPASSRRAAACPWRIASLRHNSWG